MTATSRKKRRLHKSIHRSVYISIRTCMHMAIHMLIRMTMHMAIHMSIRMTMHMSARMCAQKSEHMSIHMAIHMAVHMAIHKAMNVSTRMPMHMSTRMYARTSICMSICTPIRMHKRWRRRRRGRPTMVGDAIGCLGVACLVRTGFRLHAGDILGHSLTCIVSISALSRDRRRHGHCVGMGVPVLKTTAFPADGMALARV